jgi:hypothetical protein|tara:strand:+ start:12 stop:512 length:501 start_codon:yes stop_codon:yes gene_type:complete
MSSKFEGKTSTEGKTSSSAGGKEGGTADVPATIDVRAIRVDDDGKKGPRELEDVLRLEIDFDSDTNLNNARWNIKYMVDVVSKRYIVELGAQNGVDIRQGSNTFSFSLDSIDMSGVKRKHLINNAGLLTASLVTNNDQDVIDVNLVVQVAKSDNGSLVRHILNPLR